MNLKTISALVLTGLTMLITRSPAYSQVQADTVRIVVIDDYPAFRGSAGQQSTPRRELKALVIRSNPTGRQGSVILLNPAHLNAGTLHEALTALSVCPALTADGRGVNITALPVGQAGRPATSSRAEELELRIRELQSRPVSRITDLGGSGRLLILSGATVCRSPGAGPKRIPVSPSQ